MTSVSVPAPVARLVNAVNRSDSGDFLASFAADGVVDDCGQRFEGREAIGAWSDVELIGDNARLTVNEVRVTGDDVELTAAVVSMGFNGTTTFTFRIRDEHVLLMQLLT